MIFSDDGKNHSLKNILLPMTCFCDIPLSMISNHASDYGSYAIGMSKEWGIKNKLNPIHYLIPESNLSNHINRNIELLSFFLQDKKINNEMADKVNSILVNQIINYISNIKSFSGINHKTGKRKIFYDECEWRYVPLMDLEELGERVPLLSINEVNVNGKISKELIRQYSLDIDSKYLLKFEPSDIKYIIVQHKNEIYEMIGKIIEIKGEKYSHKDIEVLKTKISCMEDIISDY